MGDRLLYDACSFIRSWGIIPRVEFTEADTGQKLSLRKLEGRVCMEYPGWRTHFDVADASLSPDTGLLLALRENRHDASEVAVALHGISSGELDDVLDPLFKNTAASYRYRTPYARTMAKHFYVSGGLTKAAIVTVRGHHPSGLEIPPPPPRVLLNSSPMENRHGEYDAVFEMARLGILEAEDRAGWKGPTHILDKIEGLLVDGIDPMAARIAASNAMWAVFDEYNHRIAEGTMYPTPPAGPASGCG